MDNMTFNKTFFVRNQDDAYKIALMFSKYGKIDKHIQELLFFAHKDAVTNNGFNILAFTEIFNETVDYVDNWILGLKTINDESDWQIYRTKILTKLGIQSEVNFKKHLKGFEKDSPNEAFFLNNVHVIWNNAIYMTAEALYKEPLPILKKTTWGLWKSLNHYQEKEINKIQSNYESKELLENTLRYRNENQFYKDFGLCLDKNYELWAEKDKIVEELSKIFLKEELESKIPLSRAIKKIFKI